MSSLVSRSFIRARHAVALGLFAAICVLALGGALREARGYHAMVQTYRAVETMQQKAVDIAAAAALRARSAASRTDARLAALADAFDAETPRFLALIESGPPAIAEMLDPPSDVARDLAAYAMLGRMIAAPDAQTDPGPDPRFTVLVTLSTNALRPFFSELSERLGARHDMLWARSMGLATLGLAALLGALALVVGTVLRPMERIILEAQEALTRETARAQAAEQGKGALLAHTSHEIRTSLNGVIGVAELLGRTQLQPEQRRYLDVMRASGATLLRIINDVLDLSKLSAGEMSFEQRRFDFHATLRETARLFEPGLAEKGLSLNVELAGDVPTHRMGDAVRLRQALSNLLSNAAKYTQTGGVTLRAGLARGGDVVRVEVEDTGAGIPPDKLATVFESYRQLDSDLVDQTRGTGLGLALTRSMVARMGGEIGVRSAPGRGSTFWIDLPHEPAAPRAARRRLDEMRVAVLCEAPGLTARIAAPLHRWGCRVIGYGGGAIACDVAIIDASVNSAASVVRGLRAAAPEARVVALVPAGVRRRVLWADAVIDSDASEAMLRAALQARQEADAMSGHDASAGDAHGADGEADAQAGRDAVRLAALAAAGRAPRVLVADDNDVNRMIAGTLLRQLGCAVELAANGAEALEAARGSGFALVLMDVSMPVMNGLDATRAIRRIERETGRRTPIVALTAHALEEHLDHCLDAGMDARLVKPFRPEDLAQIVARFVFAAATDSEDRRAAG